MCTAKITFLIAFCTKKHFCANLFFVFLCVMSSLRLFWNGKSVSYQYWYQCQISIGISVKSVLELVSYQYWKQCHISTGISVKSVLVFPVSESWWVADSGESWWWWWRWQWQGQQQHGDFQSVGFLREEALCYTVTKRDRHLRTPRQCRKHQLQVSLFYISWVFSICPEYFITVSYMA